LIIYWEIAKWYDKEIIWIKVLIIWILSCDSLSCSLSCAVFSHWIDLTVGWQRVNKKREKLHLLPNNFFNTTVKLETPHTHKISKTRIPFHYTKIKKRTKLWKIVWENHFFSFFFLKPMVHGYPKLLKLNLKENYFGDLWKWYNFLL
jgi:hypothetical protein